MSVTVNIPSTKAVLKNVERLTAICTGLGALEEVARLREMNDDTMHSWPVRRTSHAYLLSSAARPLTAWFESPRYTAVPVAKLACSVAVIAAPSSSSLRRCAVPSLAALLWIKSHRSVYGSDGSDQVAMLSATVCSAAHLPFLRDREQQVLIAFLGAQSILSYTVAGIAKLISPLWRDGSALTGILRTRTYGDRDLHRLLSRRPYLAKHTARTVSVLETAAPLLLVLPDRIRRVGIGLMGSFHVVNARYMGLNRFLWAFVATYPAVDYLGQVITRGLKGLRR